jgi:hypothetical protein
VAAELAASQEGLSSVSKYMLRKSAVERYNGILKE